MNTQIIIDSTTNIPRSFRDKCTIVPLCVRFGDTEYLDGVTIDHKQFYEKLIESDQLPSTSQPTPDAFAQAYQKVVDAGQEREHIAAIIAQDVANLKTKAWTNR